MCFQREKYWCSIESRRGIETQWRTPPHPTTTFSQWCKTWPRPSMPMSTFVVWWVATAAPLIDGCSSTCPPTPHLIDAPQAQTVFLEEEDHRCEGRVASLRTRFRKLSGGREDEGYKRNTQMFWKILLSRREFQFLTF